MRAPTVACVMLANGRPEMVKRAVKSFRAQTYERKRLLICETSGEFIEGLSLLDQKSGGQVLYACASHLKGASIGKLRNAANTSAREIADIICHWDSDDWSHPNRIAEQVALLQSSGAECVGYNEMLFWVDIKFRGLPNGEAWLYRASIPNYAIGTSMCYWRSTWERAPFPDYSAGCDDLYWAHGDPKKGIAAVKISSVSSICEVSIGSVTRMIASIHGGNTCAKIDAKANAWRRVPEWDAYCREMMKL